MEDKNEKIKNKKDKKNGKVEEQKQQVTVQKKSANHSEIIAIIMLAICVFVIVCLFGSAGIVGQGIKAVLFGFFGIIGTIILILITIILAICILRGTAQTSFGSKNIICLALFFLTLTALFHTLSDTYKAYLQVNGSPKFFSLVASLWNASEEHPLSGGLFAGALSSVLQIFTQKVGAIVILAPATLIFAMLLFKFSLLPFTKRIIESFSKLTGKLSTYVKNVKQKNEEEKAKKEDAKHKEESTQKFENPEEFGIPKLYMTGEPLKEDEKDEPKEETSDNNVEEPPKEDPFGFDFSNNLFDFETPNTEEKQEITNNDNNEDIGDSVIDTVKGEEEHQVPVEFEQVTLEMEPKPEQRVQDVSLPVLSSGKFKDYKLPEIKDLTSDTSNTAELNKISKQEATEKAQKLIETLRVYGVEAQILEIHIGPTVTRFEINPKLGVKMDSVKRLSNEIAYSLAANAIRIEAPIPGKSAVGIEIPNKIRRTVYLKDILSADAFTDSGMALPVALGRDINGTPIVADITKLPHLLIAGTTGSGKSVCTNGLIMSLLFKCSPDDLKIILFDPKVVEFQAYDGIPHLLLPVVTDSKKAAAALAWAVMEMEKRYQYLAKFKLNHITTYNKYAEEHGLQKMPYIVIVIDEFADLMNVAKATVETSIQRLSQKARSCGMHLILATQRPSADVVTGIIKSNLNVRIALKVSDEINSRIVLDAGGAEKLQGNGDMLYHDPKGMNQRIQGVFSPMEEIVKITDFIKNGEGGELNYDDSVMASIAEDASQDKGGDPFQIGGGDGDEKLDKREENYKNALILIQSIDEISTSFIQRSLHIGYNAAADVFDKLCDEGYVERSQNPSKKSKIIKK